MHNRSQRDSNVPKVEAMSGAVCREAERQALLVRLLDAVKQCQIRFGGKKEIAFDSDSRVVCLCAQLEAVLQHGMRKGIYGLSSAIRKVASTHSKVNTVPVFWHFVHEHLHHHDLQHLLSLSAVNTDVGRGRAWLRSALNEHSLEKCLVSMLADRIHLKVFYEDWAFLMDDERASMLPTMAAGLKPIVFAINIDNEDLNGGGRGGTSISDLVRDSTHGVTARLRESAITQGVGSFLREFTTTAVGGNKLSTQNSVSEPVPIVVTTAAGREPEDGKWKLTRLRQRRAPPTIVSFDAEDESDVGAEIQEREQGDGWSQELDTQESVENEGSSLTKDRASLESGEIADNERQEDEDDADEKDEENADDVYGISLEEESEGESQESCRFDVGSSDGLSLIHGAADSAILYPLSPPSMPASEQVDVGSTRERPQAALALELAQRGSGMQHGAYLLSSQKDTSGQSSTEAMSVAELREAVVAMVNLKDELEEQNCSLRSLLDAEMGHSARLRCDHDSLARQLVQDEECHTIRVQTLARENEVLKVQLKKYVGAVQMLKREGNLCGGVLGLGDSEPSPPEHRLSIDVEELAAMYERKLIEVAEMHGELIEFNAKLQRSLCAKDTLIQQMRNELVDLRGPLPGDLSQSSEEPNLSDVDSALVNQRALVNVWIPSVFLRKKATDTHHVYQVYVRVKDEEWNVYRRYTEFRSLHQQLLKRNKNVQAFNFPPKKAIGNKNSQFVEFRRRGLQEYMRLVCNKLLQASPDFAATPTKAALVQILPFFADSVLKQERRRPHRRLPRLPRLPRQPHDTRQPEPQSGDL
uniref:sorting nexin-29 n=1 Tax=Myxine glutinosa TaxID=7769 RepID=UPI00358FA45B